MKKILLADDHKIVLDGLKVLLDEQFKIVGQALDGLALIDLTRKLSPDVVVSDISMPLLNGTEAARQIKKEFPKTKIIFLTMHQNTHWAQQALDAGASGFVIKHSAAEELVQAIHTALSGGTFLSPSVAKRIPKKNSKGSRQNKNPELLTPRQKQVMHLLAQGKSARKTAELLSISPRTVEFHKYGMMETLDIKTTAELIQFAIKSGLVPNRA